MDTVYWFVSRKCHQVKIKLQDRKILSAQNGSRTYEPALCTNLSFADFVYAYSFIGMVTSRPCETF